MESMTSQKMGSVRLVAHVALGTCPYRLKN